MFEALIGLHVDGNRLNRINADHTTGNQRRSCNANGPPDGSLRSASRFGYFLPVAGFRVPGNQIDRSAQTVQRRRTTREMISVRGDSAASPLCDL